MVGRSVVASGPVHCIAVRPCLTIFLIEMAVPHVSPLALPLQASESVVAAHFSVAGPVVKVTILRSRLTGVTHPHASGCNEVSSIDGMA